MSAQASSWRVYRDEWVIVWNSDAAGQDGYQEVVEHYERQFAGRVRPDHWRAAGWSAVTPARYPYRLELFLPCLRGEYVSEGDATAALPAFPGGVVVARDSAEELRLRRAGTVMLDEGTR